MNSPIKYPGGKNPLASKIIGLFPPRGSYCHFVEPYAGGLSVMLANDPAGISEVANDRCSWLTNFWCVLQSESFFERFKRKVEAIPFSEFEFNHASEMLHLRAPPNSETRQNGDYSVEMAAIFFVSLRQSLAARQDVFASVSRTRTRKGMNEQCSAWLTAVEGLPAVHERMKRVLVLNREATDVIRQQDGDKTLFYIDSPYVHSTRKTTSEYGEFEMTNEQHAALLLLLASIKGKFLLSGYRCDMYDNFAEDNGWSRVDFSVPNHASGAKEKRRMTESCWMNY